MKSFDFVNRIPVVELSRLSSSHTWDIWLRGNQLRKHRYKPDLNPKSGGFQHSALTTVLEQPTRLIKYKERIIQSLLSSMDDPD